MAAVARSSAIFHSKVLRPDWLYHSLCDSNRKRLRARACCQLPAHTITSRAPPATAHSIYRRDECYKCLLPWRSSIAFAVHEAQSTDLIFPRAIPRNESPSWLPYSIFIVIVQADKRNSTAFSATQFEFFSR